MTVPVLWTIPEAAQKLGVPAASLRKVADDFGKTIYIGRTVRLHPDDLPELIDKCRNAPRARASITTSERANTSFATLADLKNQQAQETANSLKKPSRSTSQKGTGQLVRLDRKDS